MEEVLEIEVLEKEIEVKIDIVTLPAINSNNLELKNWLQEINVFVKQLELKEENTKKIKDVKAKLNKLKTCLAEERKELKSKLEEPILKVLNEIKEAEKQIKENSDYLKKFTDDLRIQQRAEKRKMIESMIEILLDKSELVREFKRVELKESYLNASTTKKSITEDLKTQIEIQLELQMNFLEKEELKKKLEKEKELKIKQEAMREAQRAAELETEKKLKEQEERAKLEKQKALEELEEKLSKKTFEKIKTNSEVNRDPITKKEEEFIKKDLEVPISEENEVGTKAKQVQLIKTKLTLEFELTVEEAKKMLKFFTENKISYKKIIKGDVE